MNMYLSKALLRFAGNSSFITSRVRIRLLNSAGARISSLAVISSRFRITTPRVIIHDDVYINEDVSINTGYEGNAKVEIGKKVQIGPGCMILCVSHEIGDSSQRAGRRVHEDVQIGDGSWIGANVTILPGVKIGGVRNWGWCNCYEEHLCKCFICRSSSEADKDLRLNYLATFLNCIVTIVATCVEDYSFSRGVS